MNNNQLIALALQNDFDAELAMYDGMPEQVFASVSEKNEETARGRCFRVGNKACPS